MQTLFSFPASSLPNTYVDRLTLTTWMHNGTEAHSTLAGTYTDRKGKRWYCATSDYTKRLAIDEELQRMRNEDDAEFSIKYDVLTLT